MSGQSQTKLNRNHCNKDCDVIQASRSVLTRKTMKPEGDSVTQTKSHQLRKQLLWHHSQTSWIRGKSVTKRNKCYIFIQSNNHINVRDKLVLIHAVRACRGSEDLFPLLNIGKRWRRGISLTSRPLYPLWKSHVTQWIEVQLGRDVALWCLGKNTSNVWRRGFDSSG